MSALARTASDQRMEIAACPIEAPVIRQNARYLEMVCTVFFTHVPCPDVSQLMRMTHKLCHGQGVDYCLFDLHNLGSGFLLTSRNLRRAECIVLRDS